MRPVTLRYTRRARRQLGARSADYPKALLVPYFNGQR
jgi:hypothetical protein